MFLRTCSPREGFNDRYKHHDDLLRIAHGVASERSSGFHGCKLWGHTAGFGCSGEGEARVAVAEGEDHGAGTYSDAKSQLGVIY